MRRLAIALAPRLFARACELDREELGLFGEELAARHLSDCGWRVHGRRVPTPRGEVDLWTQVGSMSVCVEVKTARLSERALLALAGQPPADPGAGSSAGPCAGWCADWSAGAGRRSEGNSRGSLLERLRFRPGHRLDARRLARLRRCAAYLAAGSGPSRVDLVEVLLDPRGRLAEILHTEDIRRPLP